MDNNAVVKMVHKARKVLWYLVKTTVTVAVGATSIVVIAFDISPRRSPRRRYAPMMQSSRPSMANVAAGRSIRSALTTMQEGTGRLGDQIIFYTVAKWLSLKHGIPLLRRKNHDLSQLVLDKTDKICGRRSIQRFDTQEIVTNVTQFNKDRFILYLLPFGRACVYFDQLMESDDQNKDFLTLLRSYITPKRAIRKVAIPQDKISIAVHVRKGSGHDRYIVGLKQHFSERFLPDDYYIDQIRKMSDYFNDQPLYVYLFSDCADVVALKDTYERALADKGNIQLDCNDNKSRDGWHGAEKYDDQGVMSNDNSDHDYTCDDAYVPTILDDFFSMVDFDCLIRSGSHFSKSAQLLGHHKMVASPVRVHWQKETDEVAVDEVRIWIKDAGWCQKKRELVLN